MGTYCPSQPSLCATKDVTYLAFLGSRKGEDPSEAEGDSIVNLTLAESEGAIDFSKRIDVVRQAGGKDRALQISYPVNIRAGSLSVQLEPVKGSVYLCGIVLAPGSLRKSQPV